MSNDDFLKGEGGGEGSGARRAGRARAELLTLAVETATEERSAAVARGGTLLALRPSESRGGAAAAGVLEDVDAALASARVRLEEVELFAAAKGPGSFTGLRSGLATLKALAATLGRPLVGVPTLHALAHASRPAARLVAMIPAGRGEVFAQLLKVTEGGAVEELCEPAHVAPSVLLERLKGLGGGVKWAGGGALKYVGLIREAAAASGIKFLEGAEGASSAAGDEWVLAPFRGGLAASVASLGQSIYTSVGAAGAQDIKALYVRPSDAELKV